MVNNYPHIKTGPVEFTEITLCQGELAKKSHKELFALDEGSYFFLGETVTDTILSASSRNISRLHISAGWEGMLKIALWTQEKPSLFDVISLFRKSGIPEDELTPFLSADIADFFPWLYYGNRFDVLKKICSAAKAKVEGKISNKKLLVNCHLVSDEAGKIVASSL